MKNVENPPRDSVGKKDLRNPVLTAAHTHPSRTGGVENNYEAGISVPCHEKPS